MHPEDCTNPARPCHLHDPSNEWRIEFVGRTIHSGWLLGLALVAVFLTTIPWFAQ